MCRNPGHYSFMKTCNICGITKNESEFYKPYAHCIECYNDRKRKAYKERGHIARKKYYLEKVIDRREKKRIAEGVYIKKEQRRLAAIENKKKYLEKNRDKHNAERREWAKNNRPKINAKLKERLQSDVCFRIASRLRTRIYICIKIQKTSKSKPMLELLGCTIEELKQHLESKFLPGMTWENHTRDGWHIDHIKPCSSFDLSKEEEQRICFHYTNLQPLWAHENFSKSDKVLHH